MQISHRYNKAIIKNKSTKEIYIMSKIADTNEKIKDGVVGGYKKIEKGVVDGYKKIEDGVVGGYKKIENGVVTGFGKLVDKCVQLLFARKGETVEEAKARLSRKGRK